MAFATALLLLCLTLQFPGNARAGSQMPVPPIHVTSCLVVFIGHGDSASISGGMLVHFENDTAQTLKSITWRANTAAGTIDLTDTGTFSPHVSIVRQPVHWGAAHEPRNRPSLEASGPGTCVPIRTIATDGTVWELPGVLPPELFIAEVPHDSAPSTPATIDNTSHDPIGIVSCQFAIVRGRAFGHVRFRNLSTHPVKDVQFRAFFGKAGLDFMREGMFSPGVLIDTGDMTRRDLPQNAFGEYLTLDSPSSCTAVNATYADGSVWHNPTISRTEPPFPPDVQ